MPAQSVMTPGAPDAPEAREVQEAASARPGAGGSDFAQLTRRMVAEGLLDRRPGYYAVRAGLVLAAFLGGWYALFALGDTWWQLGLAAAMSVVFAQIGLLSHDLAHRQVFDRRVPSEVGGRIAANLLMGMSYGCPRAPNL